MLDSVPRTLDDFYDFLPELPSLRHYSHTMVWQRGHTIPTLPSDYHLPKVEVLDFKQNTEATGLINSMIQTCDKLKTFQLILEKIGDHISFDSLYNASTTRRQTLEHVKLWGVLDLLPSMVHLGGAFTHFTNLRSLEIDDMVLMGIPDDLDSQNLHEGWYFWTIAKPRRCLASMLPPTKVSTSTANLPSFATIPNFFGTSSTTWLRYRFSAYLDAEVCSPKPSSTYQQPCRSAGLNYKHQQVMMFTSGIRLR
jgi:hypothetical protein